MADDHSPVPPAGSSPAASPGGVPAGDSAFTPEQLKSAYNAFKKRWKLTRLDQESQIGRNPMSAGMKSTIAGIVPPDQFPRNIWEELVKKGKIKEAGRGFYSMP